MMKRPIIGILVNYSEDDSIGVSRSIGAKGQEWQVIADDYIASVEKSGGCPIIIPIVSDIESIMPIVNKLDGVIFTGGSDIVPAHYGQNPYIGLGRVCPKRDTHELRLLKFVFNEMQIPILGICRGIQLINAAFGGSLYQDLASQRKDTIKHSNLNFSRELGSHGVTIEKESRLFSIFNKEILDVNSFHHQAVMEVAEGFVVTMKAPDGVIEAIEMIGDRFVVALQWHPEMMTQNDEYLKLFEAFINECR